MRAFTRLATPLFTTALACAAVTALAGTPALGATAPPTAAKAVSGQHDIGHWQVHALGSGAYRVTWVSPTALPLTDARPVIYLGNHAITSVSLTKNTVSAIVHSASAPQSAQLGVRLSGRLLDQRTSPTVQAPAMPATKPLTRILKAHDPGQKGPHKIVTSEYTLPATKVVDISQKVEMVGHVVRPKDTDPSDPLVLFLHGRHSACYTPTQKTGPSAIQRSEAKRRRRRSRPGSARRARSRSPATRAMTTPSGCSPARATSRCRSRPTPSTRSTTRLTTVAPPPVPHSSASTSTTGSSGSPTGRTPPT